MKKIIYLLLIVIAYSCNSTDNFINKNFINNEWTVGNEILFRNDSSISKCKFDKSKNCMVGDTAFPITITDSTITYKLIKTKGKYTKYNKFVVTNDTLITETVAYDIKYIGNEPKLILYSTNYPKICTSKNKNIHPKETHNITPVKFDISGYTIGAKADRSLLKTKGLYTYDTYTIEDCEIVNNKNIILKIIGYNEIYAIERHNIPNYRIKEAIKVINNKLNIKPQYVPLSKTSNKSDYAYEFYQWQSNGVRIKLERSSYVGGLAYMNLLDTDTWTLYYDDDVQKAILIEQNKKIKPQSTIIN